LRRTEPSLKADANRGYSLPRLPRMDFVLPEFLRSMWVSDEARLRWQPRIESISTAWREMEWLTVVEGVRPCVLCSVSTDGWSELRNRSKKQGLTVVPLMVQRSMSKASAAANPSAMIMRAVIGRRRDAKRFARAWANLDCAEAGALLGYPECCCRFFADAMRQSADQEMLWTVAARSYTTGAESRLLRVDGHPELNIFWRYLGVKAVPHIPCNLNCADSLHLAEQFAGVGRSAGQEDAIAWTSEILRWPLEWSVLHGIAEMKTPIVKLCTNSVATRSRFTIRKSGSAYPEDGARGVDFPFQQQTAVRTSRFTDGLHIIYGTGQ
jgi:hypothetical protein